MIFTCLFQHEDNFYRNANLYNMDLMVIECFDQYFHFNDDFAIYQFGVSIWYNHTVVKRNVLVLIVFNQYDFEFVFFFQIVNFEDLREYVDYLLEIVIYYVYQNNSINVNFFYYANNLVFNIHDRVDYNRDLIQIDNSVHTYDFYSVIDMYVWVEIHFTVTFDDFFVNQ